ncbi:hypothetical protein GIX45_17285 [Erwinia sp. CPCC 100877]|nr:hypothetical protein [Erwinia sp. CPCC 100877]
MNGKSTAKQNNELKKQLTPENQQYYEEVRKHLESSVTKNEASLEEKLLKEILSAQKNRQSAQAAFGQSATELSKTLLAAATTQKTLSKFIFLFFLIFLQYNLFDHLLQPVIVLRFFNTVLPVILLIAAVLLGLAAVKCFASPKNRRKKYRLVVLAFACWVGSIISLLLDKQPLLTQQLIVSQQLFAGILLLITLGLLFMQFHFGMLPAGIYITTFFAVLEGCIFLNLINPIFSATGIRVLLWLVIIGLLIFSFLKITPSTKNKV